MCKIDGYYGWCERQKASPASLSRRAGPDESRKRRRPADQQTTNITEYYIIPGTDVP